MKKGWFPIYREIENHWMWSEKPFSKGQAWIDLIMLANYEDKKVPYKGKIITCERGVVNLSISYIAERWGWSRDKTRKFLKLLESDGMVTVKATTHRTTITIENYAIYNDVPTTKRQQTDNKPTTNRQQTDTTNNINNINKETNNIYIGVPDPLKEAFSDFVNMRKKIKKPITTKATVTRILNKLDKLADNDQDKILILNRSTDNCWQDVYELKGEKPSGKHEKIARDNGKAFDELDIPTF